MKIYVLIGQPQFWLGIAVVVFVWFHYRFYLRVGRRCRKCGRIWGVKRVHKIRLATDESISILSPKGKLRWWIRRVDTETFSKCKCGWIESVKIARHPISYWHLLYVKWTDPGQYREDPWGLTVVSEHAAFVRRQSVQKSLARHAENDTPPVASPLDELDEMFGLDDPHDRVGKK